MRTNELSLRVLVLVPEAWLGSEGTRCEEVGGFLQQISCFWVPVLEGAGLPEDKSQMWEHSL